MSLRSPLRPRLPGHLAGPVLGIESGELVPYCFGGRGEFEPAEGSLGHVRDLVLIFVLQAIYVAVTTVRWIILVRGQRFFAAAISFFEIILYVVALGMVVANLQDPLRVGVYALGYATGVLAGGWAEERLAVGFTVLHIITQPGSPLPRVLRSAGLGVTVWAADGREGVRMVLMAVTRRKFAAGILALIEKEDPRAFVVQTEPQRFRGGFLLKYLKPQSPAGDA